MSMTPALSPVPRPGANFAYESVFSYEMTIFMSDMPEMWMRLG